MSAPCAISALHVLMTTIVLLTLSYCSSVPISCPLLLPQSMMSEGRNCALFTSVFLASGPRLGTDRVPQSPWSSPPDTVTLQMLPDSYLVSVLLWTRAMPGLNVDFCICGRELCGVQA